MTASWQMHGIRLGNYLDGARLLPSSAAVGLRQTGEFEVVDRHEALSLIMRAVLTGSLRLELRQAASRLDGLGDILPWHGDDQEILRRLRAQVDRGALVVVRSLRRPAIVDPSAVAALLGEEPSEDGDGDGDADEGPNVYDGKILGPAGPLAGWPFLLKRDGVTIDDRSLDGSTSNSYENGAWISGRQGEFHFENLSPAAYAIEVLTPSGGLTVDRNPPPAGVNESGRRAETPEHDPCASTEDPVDLLEEEGGA
jgi:hypothetical protein